MPTSVEQVIAHLKKDIAALEEQAKRAEEMLPHVAEKYAERWKATIAAGWKQATELSALLQEIQKDHPGQ
ncbi:MAG TPA: hypothetical protein VE779_13795 [Candidatus Angelobacter sp.]|jgi:septation ring formation regulator EzrA|nr:hypothetical protein [Candidatus Angelobacter sp.]